MSMNPLRYALGMSILCMLVSCAVETSFSNDPGDSRNVEDARFLHGAFTGDIIFPIYVSDVEKSARFYREVLGFNWLGFYDYDRNVYVKDWRDPSPPIYAGFEVEGRKFGLHKPVLERQQSYVGCGRYYFRVRSLDDHYKRVQAWNHQPGRIIETHLLKMFSVEDPDGAQIYFAVTREGANLDPW